HGLYVKKFLPWLAFPTWVCDCEGVARFPWASSPVTGSYTRATGWLGHFSGWPSAVCALFPPFAAQPWWGGACQGWGAAPAAAHAEAAGLAPREPPPRFLRGLPRGGGARQGASGSRSPPPLRYAQTPPGRKPKAAPRPRHGPCRVAKATP